MNSMTIGVAALMLCGWMSNDAPEKATQTTPPATVSGGSITAGAATTGGTLSKKDAEYLESIQRTQSVPSRRQPQQPVQPGSQPSGQGYVPPQATQPRDQPLNQPSNNRPTQTMPQPGMNANVPLAPTDAASSNLLNALGIPAAPTAGASSDENIDPRTEAANRSSGPGGATMPMVPTRRQVVPPRTATSGSTYDEMAYRRTQAQYAQHPSFTAMQSTVDKPFATYQPTSGVSPWLNLYRNDRNGGVVNNYYTLVKPALDQRNMNQQFNVDLYGLERANRIQSAAMRQMNTNQRTLQGAATPQYMNYGNYYPGYGQQNQGMGQ